MTGFLASVSSVGEARQVRFLGVDVIDLKDPNKGALGALDEDSVRSIAALIGNRTTLSATIGDLPSYAAGLESAVARMHACGVDIVKVGVFDTSISPFALSAFNRLTDRQIRIVLVFFAEFHPLDIDFQWLKHTGITGVMLDTCEKANGNLRQKMDDETLSEFVINARRAGLVSGLAGSLTDEDIPPLLKFSPDYLGFRGALCKQLKRNKEIDKVKVAGIRKLIPMQSPLVIPGLARNPKAGLPSVNDLLQ